MKRWSFILVRSTLVIIIRIFIAGARNDGRDNCKKVGHPQAEVDHSHSGFIARPALQFTPTSSCFVVLCHSSTSEDPQASRVGCCVHPLGQQWPPLTAMLPPLCSSPIAPKSFLVFHISFFLATKHGPTSIIYVSSPSRVYQKGPTTTPRAHIPLLFLLLNPNACFAI